MSERTRNIARLDRMERSLTHRASLIRNGGFNMDAEKEAGQLEDGARAIRWAIEQVERDAERAAQERRVI